MAIKLIEKKDEEVFNRAAVHPLQSWEWGEFRERSGNKIVRLGGYENNKLTDAIQVVFSIIPHTKFKVGTVIRGPKPTKEILLALGDLARKESAIFIKLEPLFITVINNRKIAQKGTTRVLKLLQDSGASRGRTLFTPTTFWIDLTKSEDELLKSFHPKTRYNIRYALRHGVEIVEDNSDKAFEKYIELTRETVKRQDFYAHTERYHRLMWQFLHQSPSAKRQALLITNHQSPIARLLTARFRGEIITAWIVFVWHDFLYYPYGASSDKYKNLMANNLMMWEVIRFGKNLGLKTFDLWGREEGKGFTRFKEGYSPQIVEFIGTWDLPTSLLYWPYRTLEFARWKLLKFRSKFIKPKF